MENQIGIDPGPAFEGEDSFLRNIHRLFFRPRSYFAGIAAPKKRIWLYLFAFTYSVAYAIDRTGFSSMQGTAPAASWAEHWAIIGGAALIGSLFIFYVGGAWYRLRLGFCGVHLADNDEVMMVYLSAAQVYALPMIVIALAETLLYKNPTVADIKSPAWLGLSLLVFLFWSIYVSYAGVRTVFQPKKAAAAFWFLGGPAALYVIAFAGMFLLALSGSAALPGPDADVTHPQEFSNGDMAFSYPGNWSVTEEEETDEAWAQVQVEPIQDAMIVLLFFEPVGNAAEHLEDWSEGIWEEFEDCEEVGALDDWGDLKGAGRVITFNMGKRKYEARGFIAPLSEDRFLMVREILLRSQSDQIQPGFDLIRRTFRRLRE
jgi:hypothetical protein